MPLRPESVGDGGAEESGRTLGLKSPKDLFFGTRDGLVGRYERAIALPPRPRVGRTRGSPFFPVSRR